MLFPVLLRNLRLSVLCLTLLIMAAAVQRAAAQDTSPRIGLSASRDTYLDQIDVEFDTDFTLYVMVFGPADGVPMTQSISKMPWVIHQVCCGAVLELNNIEFNPALEHTGFPLSGTVSSVPNCIDQDSIWLATLTVRLASPQPGAFLWASGPFGAILDCAGETQFMSGLAVTINMDESPAPAEASPWGQIKAMYR